MYLPDGEFVAFHPEPTGWTHFVLNYIGPNEGEGIRLYCNGEEVDSDETKFAGFPFHDGDGKIVVGRRRTESDQYY